MRRPLFWVAFCLVVIAVLRLETGSCDRLRTGYVSTGGLQAYEQITITGQVYQKDDESVYLKSVYWISHDPSEYSSTRSRLSEINSSGYNSIRSNLSELNLSKYSFAVCSSSGLNFSGCSIAGFGFSETASLKSYETIQSVIEPQRQTPIQENIICLVEGAEKLPLGSIVTLTGTFMPFSQATNPGEFDAAEYYRILKIGGRLTKAKLLEVGRDYWRLREGLYGLKKYFRQSLYRIFPEKEASVMSALLLGDKSKLDAELKDLYKRNGILHILSISSLHITIIGMSVYRLLRRAGLPIGAAACAGSVLLLLYGGMTGFGVSACRAIGMYLLRMLAELLGRTYDMVIALGVLAAVMVTVNPYYLRHSGFLLSFTSVLGIGVVYRNLLPCRKEPPGERSLRSKLKKSLTQSMLASLSITLTTLPIQLWFYYEVPVYSVFLNLIVLPFMKPLLITGLSAMLFPGLEFLGWPDRLILKGYELLCSCFDGLPFHVWNPGQPQKWQIIVYYGILSVAVWLAGHRRERESRNGQEGRSRQEDRCEQEGRYRQENRRERESVNGREGRRIQKGWDGWKNKCRQGGAAHLLTITALSAAVLLLGFRPPSENKVTFLDVGQGDCILVQTASGENYLFDCGSSDRSGVGRYVLLPFLKYNGIHKLDAVLLSHPDADHVNGAMELFSLAEENSIKIGQLVLPAVEEAEREVQFRKIVQTVQGVETVQGVGTVQGGQTAQARQTVPVRFLAAGDGWQCGSADFLCLHPAGGWPVADSNAYSLCVYVKFAEGASLLLTGDVEGAGEEALIKELRRRDIEDIAILKTAHHGSRNATSREFLARVSPGIAVISCGRNNRYGHPHKELLERLEGYGVKVYLTPEGGAVTVRMSKKQIEIGGFLKASQHGHN